jgi:hypothetical protein
LEGAPQQWNEGAITMFLADAIALVEAAVKPLIPRKVDAKYDEKFYDAAALTSEERTQVYDTSFHAPEGSILIVEPGRNTGGVTLCTAADPTATGEPFAKSVLASFNAELANDKWTQLDTVVIPGNATSPVGAAAFGKSVADSLNKPVAAIVTGRGGVDALFETLSGGMLMAPTAKMLSAWDHLLETTMKVNPFAQVMAAKDVQDITKSVSETATLFEILKDQMLEPTSHGLAFRAPAQRRLRKIVGHSKGAWAILTALLNFELNIAKDYSRPEADLREPKVDVITFGNWVSLPDMNPIMLDLFHYHQFIGSRDVVGALGSSGYARLALFGKYAESEPVDHSANPDEYLYTGCAHNLIRAQPDHMPIEQILSRI